MKLWLYDKEEDMRDAPTLPSGSKVFQQIEGLTFISKTSKNIFKKKKKKLQQKFDESTKAKEVREEEYYKRV